MFNNKKILLMLCIGSIGIVLLAGMTILVKQSSIDYNQNVGTYHTLEKDTSTDDPLAYINEDYTVKNGFHTNLPIVLLTIDGELSEYKEFHDGVETVDEDANPYTEGSIKIIDNGNGNNTLSDTPIESSLINIKKRGHTSFIYDKPQYLIKTVDENGEDIDIDFMGMGAENSWVLNGSMADKSMIRNYLSYRIASEIGGNSMAPDSRFCEVMIQNGNSYEYRGVYLLTETVSRSESRIDIDEYKQKNTYSSYIVRRDRYTNFDPMLDTYGRLNGYSEEYIGLKYPSADKVTDKTIEYIQADFSKTEQVIYAEDEATFRVYDKYIDVDSFIDYFLINEYFGNYDAGLHSTYMYKNSGETLKIGPVWDFDQAMNNYSVEEMDPTTLAFQEKAFYDCLTKDHYFLEQLKDRYSVLQRNQLSETHVMSVIDETVEYLESSRAREWYRWSNDYLDDSFSNFHNYYLQDYMVDGVAISRFNDVYEQEIYNIKNYLHKHGNVIQTELSKMELSTVYDTSYKNLNTLLLLGVMSMFLIPSYIIMRKG